MLEAGSMLADRLVRNVTAHYEDRRNGGSPNGNVRERCLPSKAGTQLTEEKLMLGYIRTRVFILNLQFYEGIVDIFTISQSLQNKKVPQNRLP